MAERADFLVEYAREHHPVTVRGLYYQAEVHGMPGIEKDDSGYNKVQYSALKLRRAGELPYEWIADATRWMRKSTTWGSPREALDRTASTYRKALWAHATETVEIGCEKDALAGVILPVTDLNDVPLMVTRGYSSETFAFEAVEAHKDDGRPLYFYYLGDFDRAGVDAGRSLEEKLKRFAREYDFPVVFEQLAVTPEQVDKWSLPTRPPKRTSAADKKWPYDFACELDAVPPDKLRELVETAIRKHLPARELKILQTAEESERQLLIAWANQVGESGS